MKPHKEKRPELIHLGAASAVTKGAWGIYSDEMLKQHMPGLSRD